MDEGSPGCFTISSWLDRRQLSLTTVALLVRGITGHSLPGDLLWWPYSHLSLQRLYPVKQCDHEPWQVGVWACEMARSHWLAPGHQG